MLGQPQNPQKFCPAKISRHTVCVIHAGVMWYDTVMTSNMLSNISTINYYPILDDMLMMWEYM